MIIGMSSATTGTDQHTHIIDQQTGSQRIQIPEQDKHCRQIKRLRTVKQQKCQLRLLQIQYCKRHKMHGKHQHVLPQEQVFPRILILLAEYGIAL